MFRSLRWRIQIWHAGLLAIIIVVFAAVMYVQQRRTRFHEIDNELAAAVEVLVGKLQAAPPDALQELLHGNEPASESASASATASQDLRKLIGDLQVPNTFGPRRIRHQYEAPYFVIWRDDAAEVIASTTSVSVPVPRSMQDDFSDGSRPHFRNRESLREAYAPGPPGTYVLTGRFIGPDLADLRRLLLLLIGTGLVVFMLGLGGGWLLSGKSIAPIEDMSRVAAEISQHNLSQRMDVSDMDTELASLASTLNDAFGRLESAFAQQAQFTADASHELRTPLSVIRMHQDLSLSKPRTPQEYREAIETCQRATTRMTALVESLLTLARLDGKQSTLTISEFDLCDAVKAAIDSVAPLALAKEMELVTNISAIIVTGDREQVAQVLTNLLSNAIAYSPQGSQVVVSTEAFAHAVRVNVGDDGPGISADEATKVFRRFYRVDDVRSRDSGGSGLGLAICQRIVQSHGGEIGVESEVGQGSTFWFTLPLGQQVCSTAC